MSVGYCYELYPDEVPRSFKWDARDPSLERNSWGFLGIPKKKASELSSNPAQCWFGSQQCVRGRTDAHQENDERSWSRKRETMECPDLPNIGKTKKCTSVGPVGMVQHSGPREQDYLVISESTLETFILSSSIFDHRLDQLLDSPGGKI